MALSAYGIYAGVRAGFSTWFVAADAVGCWVFLVPIYVVARRGGIPTDNNIRSSRSYRRRGKAFQRSSAHRPVSKMAGFSWNGP